MVLNAWNFQPRKQLLRLTSAVHLTLLSWNIEQGRRMWTAPLGALPETLFVPHSFSLLPFPLVFSVPHTPSPYPLRLPSSEGCDGEESPPHARSQKRDKKTRINRIFRFTRILSLSLPLLQMSSDRRHNWEPHHWLLINNNVVGVFTLTPIFSNKEIGSSLYSASVVDTM